MFDGNIDDIDEAVNYILGEDKEIKGPVPKKMDKLSLKIRSIEGNNGVYYIEGENVRLERKQAYVNFETKKDFISWINEFENVYKLVENGLCIMK